MSTTIPSLKLFPLYPGGPVVQSNRNVLNANSAFYTRATEFTPVYAVNIPPTTDVSQNTNYLRLGPNQNLTQQPISQAQTFSTNLGMDANALGGLKQADIPAVAPGIPNLYKDIVSLYAITDAQFSDLMAQPDFRIPTIGMGVQIITDGMGNAVKEVINPGSYGAMPTVPVTSDLFAGPNRAEITTGATFKADPGVGLGSDSSSDTPVSKPDIPPTNPFSTNPSDAVNLTTLGKSAGIFSTDQLSLTDRLQSLDAGAVNGTAANPLLQRLAQLHPPDSGLSVVGANAQLNAEQARQLAATQAGLDVNVGEGFKQNAVQLASAARPQESYAATYRALGLDRVMDGRIPMAPSMPGAASGDNASLSGNAGFAMGAEVMDAKSKRSSGGYIPTRLEWHSGQSGSDGAPTGFGSSGQPGSMGQSGTSAGGQGGRPRRQKPMAFIA
jgi:hypothetical protein